MNIRLLQLGLVWLGFQFTPLPYWMVILAAHDNHWPLFQMLSNGGSILRYMGVIGDSFWQVVPVVTIETIAKGPDGLCWYEPIHPCLVAPLNAPIPE